MSVWCRYSFPEPGNVIVTETHDCELGQTGISSFQDNPREAARFVSESACVRDSVERIPEDKRSLSRLELLSTAGMRVLRLKSPAVAQQILGNLTLQLGLVGDMEAEANILSGVEEAVAGWVSSVRLSGKEVGALDWGGASAQLTVPDSEGELQVTVSGRQLRVKAASHLCYGQAESLKRHRAGLVLASYNRGEMDLTSPHTHTVTDPCLPSGSSLSNISLSHIFSSPCTRLADSQLLLAITASPGLVSFTSEQDYQHCSDLVMDQFRPELCNATWQRLPGEVNCLDPATISPPTNLTYLAMSTYWYLLHGLHLLEDFSMAKYLDKTGEVCSLNISSAEEQLNEVATTACFQSVLMYQLLTAGYHFNSTTWHQIQPVKRINNTEVGWGLGHAMIEASSLPGESFISLSVMIVLVTVGLLLLLLGLTVGLKVRESSWRLCIEYN